MGPTPNLAVAGDTVIDLNDYDPALSTKPVSDPELDEASLLDRAAPWFESHYRELVAGISTLDLAGHWNSMIYLFGDKVFPVALNPSDDVVVAGLIKGKVRRGRSAE